MFSYLHCWKICILISVYKILITKIVTNFRQKYSLYIKAYHELGTVYRKKAKAGQYGEMC